MTAQLAYTALDSGDWAFLYLMLLLAILPVMMPGVLSAANSDEE